MAGTFDSLMERIEAPSQPFSLQRFAVMALFEKLKRAPPNLGIKSTEGMKALRRCLSPAKWRPAGSSSAAILDEAVRQLCALVEEDFMDVVDAFYELHIALEDASCNPDVVVIIKAIGFLARYVLHHHSEKIQSIFDPSAPFHHPFVKVLVARLEGHLELLHQVLLLIRDVKFKDYAQFEMFLRPVYTFAMLKVPVSNSYITFAQRLHSYLLTLSNIQPAIGNWIFKFLVDCIKYYPLQNLESIALSVAFAEELVNALESAVRKSNTKDELNGDGLLSSLIVLCCAFVDHSINCSSLLVLLKRLVLVLLDVDNFGLHDLESVIILLGHLLTILEYEHEQIVMLSLLSHMFGTEGKNDISDDLKHHFGGPSRFTLLFPILHVMSSPSKSVKHAAFHLLMALKRNFEMSTSATHDESTAFGNELCIQGQIGHVLLRLMKYLCCKEECFITWSPYLYSVNDWLSCIIGRHCKFEEWVNYFKRTLEKSKEQVKCSVCSIVHSGCQKGIILVLSIVVNALVLQQKFDGIALDAFTAIAKYDPSLGVSFLLAALFFLDFFQKHEGKSKLMLVDILAILPSLGCHSAMFPLIMQTLQPMLHEDARRETRITALRLLCKTWQNNHRAFVYLQKYLNHKLFSSDNLDEDLALSMAACVRDVCRHDADSGVDIILSVQACIESKFPAIQALGLESLSYLCQHDVVDFYTAWVVVSRHLQGACSNSIIANSLCVLLQWGAMDAEAYPELSKQVLELIWQIASYRCTEDADVSVRVQVSAINALTAFEVKYVLECLPGFSVKLVEFLLSNHHSDVDEALVALFIKMLEHEYKTRRRLKTREKVLSNKVQKAIYGLPKLLFAKGNRSSMVESSRFWLLFSTDSPSRGKTMSKRDYLKDLVQWEAEYQNAFLELVESMQISRNLCIALISFQCLQSFMKQWWRAKMMIVECEGSSAQEHILETSAISIFEYLRTKADEVLPRVAENVAIAIGALCVVLPSSVHSVSDTAKSFLTQWLLQDAHEYKKWSAAFSLGIVAANMHATDWNHKSEIIDCLLKVARTTNRPLVMGACGIGLGFAVHGCINSISRNVTSLDEVQANKLREQTLFGKVLRTLIELLCTVCPCVSKAFEKLSQFEMLHGCNNVSEPLHDRGLYDNLKEENIWGTAGLVIGIGMSSVVLQKYSSPVVVLELTDIFVSWIPYVNSWKAKTVANSINLSDISSASLTVGSSLCLNVLLNICNKLGIRESGMECLLNGFRTLITELSKKQTHGYVQQNLLMSCCVGSGNVLSCILNEAIQPIKLNDVVKLMEAIQATYREPYPPIVHFGGMMGIVKTMTASAGLTSPLGTQAIQSDKLARQTEVPYLRGSILANTSIEPFLLSLINEIIGAVRNSTDVHLQNFAVWSLFILRSSYFDVDQDIEITQEALGAASSAYHSIPLNDFPKDSLVHQLSSLLLNTTIENGSCLPSSKLAVILQCLEKSQLLPSLDWGVVMKVFMRYQSWNIVKQIADYSEIIEPRGICTVQEACLHFAFAHAHHNASLLNFLDELCDLSRFKTLEHALQSLILHKMTILTKTFSRSRMERFFIDIIEFFNQQECPDSLEESIEMNHGCILLQTVFWGSLRKYLKENPFSVSENYMTSVLKSIEIMFRLLPFPPMNFQGMCKTGSIIVAKEEEWSQAIECLKHTPKEWLLQKLLTEEAKSPDSKDPKASRMKIILARCKLVLYGHVDHSALTKFHFNLLNNKLSDTWRLLVDVAVSLSHASMDVKKQWLFDTIEMISIVNYPSTALRFLGLLTSSWSAYAPSLIIDPSAVLEDLPLTFSLLFHDSDWCPILSIVLHKLSTLIEQASHRKMEWEDKKGSTIVSSSKTNDHDYIIDILCKIGIQCKSKLPFDTLFRIANLKFS